MTLRDAIQRLHVKRVHLLEKDLGEGAAKDYNEYKFIIGRIQGMSDLMQEIDSMLAQNEQDALDDTGG